MTKLSQFSQYTLNSENYNSQELSVLLKNRKIAAKMILL